VSVGAAAAKVARMRGRRVLKETILKEVFCLVGFFGSE
jgi:hypothetical protein